MWVYGVIDPQRRPPSSLCFALIGPHRPSLREGAQSSVYSHTTVYIRLNGLTETNVMFDYVYGVLNQSGMTEKAHKLAHMLNDGLVNKAEIQLSMERS